MNYTHFRQKTLIDNELLLKGSISYKYRGKEHVVTAENVDILDRNFIQSLSTYLSKNSPKPVPVKVPGEGEMKDLEFGQGFDKTQENKVNQDKIALIQKELLRISYSEMVVEEKLRYPKVFEKLMTEPHLALEQFKKTYEPDHKLAIYVDLCNGYHVGNESRELHGTIITAVEDLQKKYKKIHLYRTGGSQLKDQNKHHFEHALDTYKPDTPVIVLSQGCGHYRGDHNRISPIKYRKNFYFCTCFTLGRTCGCNTIPIFLDRVGRKNIIFDFNKAEMFKKIQGL